jgi:hypothetical protein
MRAEGEQKDKGQRHAKKHEKNGSHGDLVLGLSISKWSAALGIKTNPTNAIFERSFRLALAGEDVEINP